MRMVFPQKSALELYCLQKVVTSVATNSLEYNARVGAIQSTRELTTP